MHGWIHHIDPEWHLNKPQRGTVLQFCDICYPFLIGYCRMEITIQNVLRCLLRTVANVLSTFSADDTMNTGDMHQATDVLCVNVSSETTFQVQFHSSLQ